MIHLGVKRSATISDKGRTPIGAKSVEEAEELQKLIIESVSEETCEEWRNFRDSRHVDALSVFASDEPQIDQCYPKKIKSAYTETSTETEPDIKKKKKKIVEQPTQFEIEAKKREELRKQILETVHVNKKSRKIDVEDVLGETKKIPEQPSTSGILEGYGFVDDNFEEKEECVLFKNGHCFNFENCQFAHNGIVYNNRNLSSPIELPDYSSSHQIDVELCHGYLNQTCWNMTCAFRHILYTSDLITST